MILCTLQISQTHPLFNRSQLLEVTMSNLKISSEGNTFIDQSENEQYLQTLKEMEKENDELQKKVIEQLLKYQQQSIIPAAVIRTPQSRKQMKAKLSKSFGVSIQCDKEKKYLEIIQELVSKLFQQKVAFRSTLRSVKKHVRTVKTALQKDEEGKQAMWQKFHKEEKEIVSKLVMQLARKLEEVEKLHHQQLNELANELNASTAKIAEEKLVYEKKILQQMKSHRVQEENLTQNLVSKKQEQIQELLAAKQVEKIAYIKISKLQISQSLETLKSQLKESLSKASEKHDQSIELIMKSHKKQLEQQRINFSKQIDDQRMANQNMLDQIDSLKKYILLAQQSKERLEQQLSEKQAISAKQNQNHKNDQVNPNNNSNSLPAFSDLLSRSIDMDAEKFNTNLFPNQDLIVKDILESRQLQSYEIFESDLKQVEQEEQKRRSAQIFNPTANESQSSPDKEKRTLKKVVSLSQFYKSKQEIIKSEFEDASTFLYYYSSYLENYFQSHFLVLCREVFFKKRHENNQFSYLRLTCKDLNRCLFDLEELKTCIKEILKSKQGFCSQYSLAINEQKQDRMPVTIPTEETQMSDRSFGNNLQQFSRIENELHELKSYFEKASNQYHQSNFDSIIAQPQNSKVVNDLDRLKDNKVAQMISLLMKENSIVKKCMNQMMNNEEKLAKFNNDAYFEEISSEEENLGESSEARRVNNSILSKGGKSVVEKKHKDVKQDDSNCLIY